MIDLPDAVSPTTLLGEGQDQRTLAFAPQGLQIDETAQNVESESNWNSEYAELLIKSTETR